MTTLTEAEALDGTLPSFDLVLSEPALTVSAHLVCSLALPGKALAVCLADPARPAVALVQEHDGWKFSQRLERSFVYAPTSKGPSIVSLPVANLNHASISLQLTVHPWSRGAGALASSISAAWFGISRTDGSFEVAKVVCS